jgi:cation transport ATPase
MELSFNSLNWLAIIACVVLPVGFASRVGAPWAKAYGAADKKSHAREVPGYTYAVGLLCMILLTVGLAVLQRGLAVASLGDGLTLGLFVAVAFCIATALPGYAFLRRWSAFFLAIGAQIILIMILSAILSVWQ